MAYRLWGLYPVVFLLTAVFSVTVAAVAIRHRPKREAVSLAVLMLGVGIWSAADALRLGAPTASEILFWNRVAYVGIVMIPPAFVTFVLAATNRERWLRRRTVVLLAGISVLALAVVLTNQWHGLWRAGETVTPQSSPPVLDEHRGTLWYVWAIHVYALALAMLYLLFRSSSSGTSPGSTGTSSDCSSLARSFRARRRSCSSSDCSSSTRHPSGSP
ncbi:histidine kinase N-terminal 7TM domain-containing protein [Halomicroarcula sp. GCM10025709]|uniref:histidine kinase N-terminal 7TM domain-containing protein n=1 Tax=Halomicroarcula sp. GCM10025709 TaxID=3252669 RepID=UPI003609CB84